MVDENARAPDAWAAVDDYLDTLHPPDPALDAALRAAADADLPEIQVSPSQGRLLRVIAQSVQAKHILEIGTLAGYSGIFLARALGPGGRLVTLESDRTHAAVAERNFRAAGLADRVALIVGPALTTLPALRADYPGGFDVIFIDADKETYPEYWSWALRLAHTGTVIIADNVVRRGEVANTDNHDAQVVGVRTYLETAAREPRVLTSVVQTVGGKGYDGLAVSLVQSE